MQFSKTIMPTLTQLELLSWFEEHEGELQHFPWPTQLPDMKVTEPLWSVSETRVRYRFPPPTSLKQVEDFLQEEWYQILLKTVENLYGCIPGRITAVLKAKDGPTSY
jgi:hypothetical protein